MMSRRHWVLTVLALALLFAPARFLLGQADQGTITGVVQDPSGAVIGNASVTLTMENASLLARSEYYAEWRGEVQRVFEAINAAAHGTAAVTATPPRLMVLILPRSLPIDPLTAWKQWDSRGTALKLAGDPGKLSRLLRRQSPRYPTVLADREHSAPSLLFASLTPFSFFVAVSRPSRSSSLPGELLELVLRYAGGQAGLVRLGRAGSGGPRSHARTQANVTPPSHPGADWAARWAARGHSVECIRLHPTLFP